MVALHLVFVSLLSALVATALPLPQVAPAADSSSVATDGASVDALGFGGYAWKRQDTPVTVVPAAADGSGAVAPPAATPATTTDGAVEDWSSGGFFQSWKRQDDTPAVVPAAADEDTTTEGASVDALGFGGYAWKRDDAPVAPVAPAAADSTPTEEGDFHADALGFGGYSWKRDDAVAPAARV